MNVSAEALAEKPKNSFNMKMSLFLPLFLSLSFTMH